VQTISRLHRESGCTYGSPRITRALHQRGCRVSENRVARLMRRQHIKAAAPRCTEPTPERTRFTRACRTDS